MMLSNYKDTIWGFSVSAIGFITRAVTHSDVDKWLGTIAGAGGAILVFFTIFEKAHQWRIRNRKLRRFEAIRSARTNRRVIIPLLVAGSVLAVSGCATPRKLASVARVVAPIERADVVAVQSRARVTKVQAKITTAKDAVTVLKKTATAEQWPAIDKIDVSLTESTRLLNEELEQNEILTISLNTARDALTDVLLEQERIVKELKEAEEKAAAYTRLRLWLATVAALLAARLMWQFLPGFLGPYKWYAVAGAGAAAFTATFWIL